MKKIKFTGYYLRNREIPKDDGGTLYGNYLYYAINRLIEKLRNEYDIKTVTGDDFDIIVIDDLDLELYEYAKSLPAKTKKILQLTESVIYTPFAHIMDVLTNPIWTHVVSYNREFYTPNMIYYDIAVTGIQKNVNLSNEKRFDKICHIASYKNDIRGYTHERDSLVKNMVDKKIMDIYGTGWQKLMLNEESGYGGKTSDKVNTISKYKYYFASENAKYSGYVTEKLGDAILAETPCIYFGDIENAQRRFPNTFVPVYDLSEKSFTNAFEELKNNYDFYYQNVLLQKKESIHWCDSYFNALVKAITS